MQVTWDSETLQVSPTPDEMQGVTHYVLGFLFGETSVALIQKTKPDWMAGRLNGIGGKVEPGENALEAMRREFLEEAGVDVPDWKPFGILVHGKGHIFLFKAVMKDAALVSMTEEKVGWHTLEKDGWRMMPNLHWLIPMANSTSDEMSLVFDPSTMQLPALDVSLPELES